MNDIQTVKRAIIVSFTGEIVKPTTTSRRRVLRGIALAGLTTSAISTAAAQGQGKSNTGKYNAIYAYDQNGDWYGKNMSNRGLETGTVDSIDELDQDTLTTCYYKVLYGGSFGNDPYLDTGWIRNNVRCKGYEPDNRNVLFVHESDPRYEGDPDQAIWGTWEYHVDAQRGKGNTLITDKVRPAQD